MSREKQNHLRTIFIVISILVLLFGFLAYIANPEPEQTATELVPEGTRPLSEVLARMSEDKVKDPGLGMTSVKALTKKMQASLEEPEFHLGPFEIGMTFQEFLGATTGHNKILAVKTGVMGVYNVLPDRFNVFFRKAQDKEEAFQMSYHRVLERRKAEEVKDHLELIWGRPTEASCKPVQDEPGEICLHTWWPVNGVRLEAKIRATEKDANNRSKIDLRVDAYDDLAQEREREQAKEKKKNRGQ